MSVKIGDKVRFLNSVGGGVVRRFQGKDIVLVEEEDGFETPVLIRECVVVEQQIQVSKTVQPSKEIQKAASRTEHNDPVYTPEEIKGNDALNVYLAFLPVKPKELSTTNYEAYIINESNYYLSLSYLNRTDDGWKLRYQEEIEPNTRLFMEEFVKEDLNDLERVCIQFTAYKKDKAFALKNAVSVEIRVDTVKFYKLHSFKQSEFFNEGALVYNVVRNDLPVKEMVMSHHDLETMMNQKARVERRATQRIDKSERSKGDIVEVDLHIEELIDDTTGMDNTAILHYQMDEFRRVLDQYKQNTGQKIVFIHGKGEGVLRKALMDELRRKYSKYGVQDASFQEYGYGATMVTIK
ncbi:MAG: DUF2027 domain-containing protein [Tannerellaceae bacterium]